MSVKFDNLAYEKAINDLQKYSHIPAARSIIVKATERLLREKETSEFISTLVMEISKLLNELQVSDRTTSNMMRIMTNAYMENVIVMGQNFVALRPDVFSLKARSGTYTFTIEYNISNNNVTLTRNSMGERPPCGALHAFFRFPTFTNHERDIKIITNEMRRMRSAFQRTYKYLKTDETPSNTDTSMDDVLEFLDNPV